MVQKSMFLEHIPKVYPSLVLLGFSPVISLHFHAAALLVRSSELWAIVQMRKPEKHDTSFFLMQTKPTKMAVFLLLVLGDTSRPDLHLVAE